ncbi:MAG: hypothetical protein ONB24_13510 [candidate division KSB1 bacterium]|nr:hypothetical protein [candidate division KSB1 bacterium]
MPIWHKSLRERFDRLPPHQQILLVANELNRTQNLLTQPLEYRNALERALELMDFMAADRRWIGKLRELRRAREVTAMYYAADRPQPTAVLMRCFIQLDSSAWRYLHGLPKKDR